MEKTGINITVITKRAGYKRGTYYSHIKKKDLSIATLRKYGKAIGHDFSEELPHLNSFMVEEEDEVYENEPKTIQQAIRQRNLWKQKYYDLMEKYVRCMEGK